MNTRSVVADHFGSHVGGTVTVHHGGRQVKVATPKAVYRVHFNPACTVGASRGWMQISIGENNTYLCRDGSAWVVQGYEGDIEKMLWTNKHNTHRFENEAELCALLEEAGRHLSAR